LYVKNLLIIKISCDKLKALKGVFMSVSKLELEKIAKLSALKFSDAEMQKLQKDFDNILSCVNAVKNFKEESTCTSGRSLNASLDLRADEPKKSISVQDIELNAPEFFAGAIVVPAVVE
jgi:aspartyl-tRNA(Asn)/glutamyl-tRNA(Gln) amidotransferase subunit C